MRTKIAIVADTQLYKRLYGLNETKEDWYAAFESAFAQITSMQSDIAAVLLLGDIMDANEVGSSAAYVLQKVLQDFSATKIPIGMILGNHDNERSSPHTWVEVCELVNQYLTRLTLAKPFTVNVGTKTLNIYGTDNGSRERIASELSSLSPIAKSDNTEDWLCLHQALKQLAPHRFAWDVTAEQIPDWFDRVFLGDFHNTAQYTDVAGRKYIYPGSIETVSFNQTETPGFIVFDTQTNTFQHYSTQQREYLTYDSEGKSAEQMLPELVSQIEASTGKFHGKRPVVRVLYTAENYNDYLTIQSQIESISLQLFAVEKGTEKLSGEFSSLYTGNIAESGIPHTKDGILNLLPEILQATGIEGAESEDIQKLILNPENISAIKSQRFPDAVYKKVQI